jgi:uncharacterized membrane protein
MFLAYAVTGQLEFVASIGIGDVILKMIFYYLHEKAWNSTTRSILGFHVFRSFLRNFASNKVSSLIRVSIVCLLPTLYSWNFNSEFKELV